MAFALVITAQRLRPYFQAHTIRILTDQPLRMILHKPKTSGRIVKWLIELSEFDIEYHPRGEVKGQAVVDFIAECTHDQDAEPGLKVTPQGGTGQDEWVVHVDGSSTNVAIGGGSS